MRICITLDSMGAGVKNDLKLYPCNNYVRLPTVKHDKYIIFLV